MPSGAKKRKAAKKKQENHHSDHENQPQNPHADEEDSKQESQDSDVGEGTEAKEAQIEGIQQINPAEEEDSIRVESEFDIEDESTTKNGSYKNDTGSSRSYSSTSLDSSENASHDDDAKISDHIDVEKPIKEANHSISSTPPAIDSEKIPSPSEKPEASSSEVDEEEDSKQQSQEGVEAKEPRIEVIEQRKPADEEENPIRVEREFNIEDESTPKNDVGSSSTSNGGSESEPHDDDDAKITGQNAEEMPPIEEEEAGDSISATSPAVDSEISSFSEKAEAVGSDSLSPGFVGSVNEEENGHEKQQPSVEDDDKDESSLFALPVEISVSEIALPIEKNEVVDQNGPSAEETDKNLAVSYDAATKLSGDIGVLSEPDSGFTQPYIAQPPPPSQRTSWKDCCGIFEVLKGSGR